VREFAVKRNTQHATFEVTVQTEEDIWEALKNIGNTRIRYSKRELKISDAISECPWVILRHRRFIEASAIVT